jgi:hypothetical protein
MVTITGTGFLLGRPEVLFGNLPCVVQSVEVANSTINDTNSNTHTLVCVAPPSGAASLPLTVRTPSLGGTAGPLDPFVVTYPLEVAEFAPLRGSAFGRTLLTVRGFGFAASSDDNTTTTTVGLGVRASEIAYPCHVITLTPTELTCLTPAAGPEDYGRPLRVYVQMLGGGIGGRQGVPIVASSEGTFQFLAAAAPRVLSVTPAAMEANSDTRLSVGWELPASSTGFYNTYGVYIYGVYIYIIW